MTQRTFLLVIALCAVALTISWVPNDIAAAFAAGLVIPVLALGGFIVLYVILAAIDMGIWWVTHVSRGIVQGVFADAKGQDVAVVQVGRIRPKTIGVLTWVPECGRGEDLFSPGKAVLIVKRGPRFRAVPYVLAAGYNRPVLLQLAFRVFAPDIWNSWKEEPSDERALTLDVPPSECAAGSAS